MVERSIKRVYRRKVDKNVDTGLYDNPPHFHPPNIAQRKKKQKHHFVPRPCSSRCPTTNYVDITYSFMIGLMMGFSILLRIGLDMRNTGAGN